MNFPSDSKNINSTMEQESAHRIKRVQDIDTGVVTDLFYVTREEYEKFVESNAELHKNTENVRKDFVALQNEHDAIVKAYDESRKEHAALVKEHEELLKEHSDLIKKSETLMREVIKVRRVAQMSLIRS